MATWDDLRHIALALPEVAEDTSDHPSWRVKSKSFVWDRPLRRADLHHLGAAAPHRPVIGVYIADLGEKAALIATEAPIVFTTPHFDGYPAVLVCLDAVDATLLEELVVDAWLARAPKRLATSYLATCSESE